MSALVVPLSVVIFILKQENQQVSILVVIENPEECPLQLQGIEPVAARTYLTDSSFASMRGVKIFNICKSYRYQSMGYYVSLLAEARGHKSIPGTTTIQDMKSVGLIRLVSDSIEEVLKKSLAAGDEKKLSLNIYFGKTTEKKIRLTGGRPVQGLSLPFSQGRFQPCQPVAAAERLSSCVKGDSRE